MCGIVGYTGMHSAAPVLLDGLSKLEYRGYDSAGIAVRDGEKQAEVIKAKGRLKKLIDKTNGGDSVPGTCGIGHTRWATHGEPSENNAHPHMSDDGNVVAVHNGIIENYQELKDKLIRNGYTFYSETDTEVAVKLVDYYYKKYEGTPVDALTHADHVILADIYAARETDTLGMSSEMIAEELKKKGCDAYYFPSFEEIENFCLDKCQKGDVLITMGAGNVVNIGENLLKR